MEIPRVPLPDFVLQRARELGDKPAFVEGVTGRSIAYRELEHAVCACSAALTRRSLGKGDVLAILAPNSIEYPIAFHATAHAGAVVTTINPLSTCDEVTKQLTDSGARFLLTTDALADKALAAARASGIEHVFTTGSHPALEPLAPLLSSAPEPSLRPALDPREGVAALPYSSGTTGLPKGVMLTHSNLVANVMQLNIGHMHPDDVFVCVLPLFHIYGLSAIMNIGLRLGVTTVLLPRYELETLLAVIQKFRVTFAHLVPPILLELVKNPLVERFDLSSLRSVFSGAAPLSAELSLAVGERLACRVIQGYGMTEASPATHLTPLDPAASEHGTVGLPLADTEARLVDPVSGRDVQPGEPGEVWARGPQVMKGYLGNPAATRTTVDPQGWLHTGDIGVLSARGNLTIVDRVKELIKYKAWQIAPAELEAVLLTHPAVADAAVIGVPDPEAGEIPKAIVVRRAPVTSEELLRFAAERVAPHKRIRLLAFSDQIPKSPSGKILRRLLVAEEKARRPS